MAATATFPFDLLTILWRRKWWFLVPFALVSTAALAVAFTFPPVYRSEATILIEEADIPQDLQGMLASEYVEKRFEAISRRVTVSDSLLSIIDRYGLYPQERAQMSVAKLTDMMRGNISREMVRANVVDPRSGERRNLTVAFNIAFDHGNAEIAQRVTNELVTLYLNENLRQRRERADETRRFLRSSLEEAELRLRQVTGELAAFKAAHVGLLPEDRVANQTTIGRLEAELRDLDRQIQAAAEREAFYATQLAQTEPYLFYTESGQQQSPTAKLETMRAELLRLRARYSPDHPDVLRQEREVEALEAMAGGSRSTTVLRRDRDRVSQELATLSQTYNEQHPEVLAARRRLAQIDDALRAAQDRPSVGSVRPDNPAYISLQAQLAATRTELEAWRGQRDRVEASLTTYREREAKAPEIEGQYITLERQLHEAEAALEGVNRMDASMKLGQSLETEIRAEQLSLIEPPSLPDRPIRPNRKLILLAGLILGFAAGAATLTVAHKLDRTIRSPAEIAGMVGVMPLAVVPHFMTPRERAMGMLRPVLLVSVLAFALLVVHVMLTPLNLLAQQLQERVITVLGANDAVRR